MAPERRDVQRGVLEDVLHLDVDGGIGIVKYPPTPCGSGRVRTKCSCVRCAPGGAIEWFFQPRELGDDKL